VKAAPTTFEIQIFLAYGTFLLVLKVLQMRYNFITFTHPVKDPATKGFKPILPPEHVLAKSRLDALFNGKRWYAAAYKFQFVLTEQRLCVRTRYAAKGYWLFTIPTCNITHAAFGVNRGGLPSAFYVQLSIKESPHLQTLLIYLEDPSTAFAWQNALSEIGTPTTGNCDL